MDQNEAENGQGAQPENNQIDQQQPGEVEHSEMASMESLLEEEGLGLDFPKQGEVRPGFIATLGDNEILVSVGTKSEGVISGRELEQIPSEERAKFKVGMEIPVYVLTPEDSNGNVVLSYLRAREENDWEIAESHLEEAKPFDSKVIGYNKGGLLVPLGRLRGFVPASQISLLRRAGAGGETPDQRWGKMVGDPITVRVIEVDRERRRLILSERAALQETRESLKERLLDELQEGDVRKGRVTSVADFGAFVNIDGADGLVHLSEISWERIQHPNEVVKVGQEVEVKVISIDRDRKRIGLSIRQLQMDPWVRRVEKLREGQLIEATVTHLTKFGAFARIDEDLEGLIHVSELSEHRIGHPKEIVKEGDNLTLRIIKIDPERRRIGLSLRKVDSPAYSDLDWKMALAEEVGEAQEEISSPEGVVEGEKGETEGANEPVDEIEATEPVDEIEETEPVDEIEETEPVDEIEETVPVDEIEATEPVDEIEATEPVDEVEETELVDEIEATEPVDEIEATEPVDEIEATEPVDEIEATEPVDEIEATEPVDEIEATEPVDEIEAAEEEPSS